MNWLCSLFYRNKYEAIIPVSNPTKMDSDLIHQIQKTQFEKKFPKAKYCNLELKTIKYKLGESRDPSSAKIETYYLYYYLDRTTNKYYNWDKINLKWSAIK
jgi:hypothetical protein